jgi:uncharacterized protein DUF1236
LCIAVFRRAQINPPADIFSAPVTRKMLKFFPPNFHFGAAEQHALQYVDPSIAGAVAIDPKHLKEREDVMLKYSITALALVAGSTFALAEPNSSGQNGPGSSGGAMEHSGSTSGGATKGNAGGSELGGGKMGGAESKGDRSSAGAGSSSGEAGAGPSRENTRSDQGLSKPDRQANDNEKNAKPNKQAQDKDRNLKNNDRADKNDRSDRNERMGADQSRDKTKADRSSTGASEGVEGKGGAKGSITNVTTEQRSQVKSVFLSHRVEPARVNIAVNVGVRVPRSVHFYPIPEDIVTIVPDYRGYEYFQIDEAHVAIVDPDTLEVVDIIVVA